MEGQRNYKKGGEMLFIGMGVAFVGLVLVFGSAFGLRHLDRRSSSEGEGEEGKGPDSTDHRVPKTVVRETLSNPPEVCRSKRREGVEKNVPFSEPVKGPVQTLAGFGLLDPPQKDLASPFTGAAPYFPDDDDEVGGGGSEAVSFEATKTERQVEEVDSSGRVVKQAGSTTQRGLGVAESSLPPREDPTSP